MIRVIRAFFLRPSLSLSDRLILSCLSMDIGNKHLNDGALKLIKSVYIKPVMQETCVNDIADYERMYDKQTKVHSPTANSQIYSLL